MPPSALFAANFLFAAEPSIVVMRVADGRLLKRTGPVSAPTHPGSTMKPFTLAALLDQPGFDAARRVPCSGRLTIAGRRFDCTHGPAVPAVNASEAIAYSCNHYFAHYARLFQLRLDAALPALTPRSLDQSAMQAVGEWGVDATPETLANAYRQLALRENEPKLAPLFTGLRDACTRGTARQAGPEFAGKTGTAATSSRLSLQAWFAGFTPPSRPTTVVVVFVPHGRGATDAAPLARKAIG